MVLVFELDVMRLETKKIGKRCRKFWSRILLEKKKIFFRWLTSAFSKIGAKVSKRSLQLHSTCPEQNRQSKNNSRKRFCFCELFQIRSKKFTAFRQKRLGSFDQNAFYVSIRTMWAGFFFEILYVHIYLRTSTEKVLEFHLKILPQQQSTFPEKCLEGNYSFWKCFFEIFFNLWA